MGLYSTISPVSGKLYDFRIEGETPNQEELDKILLNPDYAESLGVKVYVEVKDNGEKYAVLNNGEEEIELKIKQK